MSRIGKLFLLASTGVSMAIGGCLPDNFWADKWGEIVNGQIIDLVDGLDLLGGLI